MNNTKRLNNYLKTNSNTFYSGVISVILASMPMSILFTTVANASSLSAPVYRYSSVQSTTSGDSVLGGLATDSKGDLYEYGQFYGSVTLGGTNGTHVIDTGNNNWAVYLTKYSKTGAYLWSRTSDNSAGNGANSGVGGMAIDSSDNVYINGFYQGDILFDGPGGVHSSPATNPTGFLTKYSSDGSYQWTKTDDTSVAGSNSYPNAIAIDKLGNIYTSGGYGGTDTFDGPGGATTLSTSAVRASFLTKYSRDGSYLWTKTDTPGDNTQYYYASNIVIDSSNNVYMAGSYVGTDTFDGHQISAQGTYASYVVKYDNNGNYLSVFTDAPTAGSSSYLSTMAIDKDDNLYIGGSYNGDNIFDGPGGTHNAPNSPNSNAFLTKISSGTTYSWTRTAITTESGSYPFIEFNSIVFDPSGNIYTSGDYRGDVTFDGPGGNNNYSSPNQGTFFTKFTSDGAYDYTRADYVTGSGSANQKGTSVVDNLGNIYIGGVLNGTDVFDGINGSDSFSIGGQQVSVFYSYQIFDPASTAPLASVNPIKAPITGFSSMGSGNDYTPIELNILGLTLIIIAIVCRKYLLLK